MPKVEDEDSAVLDSPERALLTAVLERAIRDAAYLRAVKPGKAEHWFYEEAKTWLGLTGDVDDLANSYKPWTYSWVCQHLDLDPEAFRASILSLLGEELYHRLVWMKARPKLKFAHKGFRCGGDHGTIKAGSYDN